MKTDSQRIDEHKRLEQLRALCPAISYKPNTPAPEEWILSHGGSPGTRSRGDDAFFDSTARRRVNIGGNRAGKTTKLVLEVGSFCLGMRPWYPPGDPRGRKGLKLRHLPKHPDGRGGSNVPVPVRCRYVVPNFGVHLPEVIKEFEKWWPRDWWDVKARDERGTPREFKWFNGSWIGFMSHKMRKEDFEGIEMDLIAWDEPPPRELWVALERGIVSTGGRSIIGATLLNASGWFWNEIVIPVLQGDSKSDIEVTFHSIWDNTAENGGCPEQTCENVLSWLESIPDPDERLAREHGIAMHLGGKVLSGYSDANNLIDPIEIPKSAHIIAAIDPAGTRPFAALHVAYLERGDDDWIGLVFDETWVPQTRNDLGAFCQIFRNKEKGLSQPKHPRESEIILIDPVSEEIQKADHSGRTLRRILSEDYKIDTVKADRRGKRARLLSLNACIKEGKYKFFSDLRRTRQEMRRWSWDESKPKLTSGPDDVMDCLSYIHSLNPGKLLRGTHGEEEGGVWVPEAYRERRDRETILRERAARVLARRSG